MQKCNESIAISIVTLHKHLAILIALFPAFSYFSNWSIFNNFMFLYTSFEMESLKCCKVTLSTRCNFVKKSLMCSKSAKKNSYQDYNFQGNEYCEPIIYSFNLFLFSINRILVIQSLVQITSLLVNI